MAEKLDPFDVNALERSLNDSATRVSTIWISFLVFGLYLVVAAGTVTHRQLFLEDPIKLPVLNIDLPMVGFFFLAPILFVVFHVYVLLQVLLLSRTAVAYNKAIEYNVKVAADSALIRQRLANTLFAQIFAGSPRERKGWLGLLLNMMAWLTLAVAPVLVLLVFQFQFLPYHSQPVTWTLRFLIAIDLVAVLVLWPALRDPDRDVSLRVILRRWVALPCGLGLIALSWIFLTFPGEPHAKWTRYWPGVLEKPSDTIAIECWTRSPIAKVKTFSNFDRLNLPHVDVIDHQKLRNIEANTKLDGQPDYQGERTKRIGDRNLDCADLSDFSDLRRVDLTKASLRGSSLERAQLQGATLASARLQDSTSGAAKLQGADLQGAQLQGTKLYGAQLQGAYLKGAHLQGANLGSAKLQGADLRGAELQGADLQGAQLQGVYLYGAQLQGANLQYAQLQGATLWSAQLQGADLSNAKLEGADFYQAQLQGANLVNSSLEHAIIRAASVWRAKRDDNCQGARVFGLDHLALNDIAGFINKSLKDVPGASKLAAAIKRMQAGLIVAPANDDTASIERDWIKLCVKKEVADFEEQRDLFLSNFICEAKENREAISTGIIRNERESGRSISTQLAVGVCP
jgi:uncharacterized protein YjbI with pentapeptide repeats